MKALLFVATLLLILTVHFVAYADVLVFTGRQDLKNIATIEGQMAGIQAPLYVSLEIYPIEPKLTGPLRVEAVKFLCTAQRVRTNIDDDGCDKWATIAWRFRGGIQIATAKLTLIATGPNKGYQQMEVPISVGIESVKDYAGDATSEPTQIFKLDRKQDFKVSSLYLDSKFEFSALDIGSSKFPLEGYIELRRKLAEVPQKITIDISGNSAIPAKPLAGILSVYNQPKLNVWMRGRLVEASGGSANLTVVGGSIELGFRP